MSRLPQFLDSQLTDGGKVVSLRHLPSYISQENSWYSFLLEAESTPRPIVFMHYFEMSLKTTEHFKILLY
jgi:hypothetical protein